MPVLVVVFELAPIIVNAVAEVTADITVLGEGVKLKFALAVEELVKVTASPPDDVSAVSAYALPEKSIIMKRLIMMIVYFFILYLLNILVFSNGY